MPSRTSARPAAPGLLVLALCVVLPGVAGAAVNVQKKPAVVQTRTFDPASPPKEMPTLHEGEAALTESMFFCGVLAQSHVGGHTKSSDGGFETTITVYGVKVTLELKVTIWDPENAAAKLKAHEEGHRQIAEQVYATADQVARAAAKKVEGRRFTGHGDTAEAAAQAALKDASQEVIKQYVEQAEKRAERVGQIYDDLTAHGTKAVPAEPEAIKQAFEKYDAEVAKKADAEK